MLYSGDSPREFVVQTPSSDMGNFGLIVVGLTHNGKMINSVGQSSSRHLKSAQKNLVASEEKHVDDHKSVMSNVLGTIIPSIHNKKILYLTKISCFNFLSTFSH